MRIILAILIALSLACPATSAQEKEDVVKSMIEVGIQRHDANDFQGAVEKYKQALKLAPDDPLANYEIALSYFSLQDYENSYRHAQKVLKLDKNFQKDAYNIGGSALDAMGKPKEAVKLYRKAIKAFPDDYLLRFNLALTAFNLKDYAGSEEGAAAALRLNPFHPTSHLILSYTCDSTGRKVESMLAAAFFLLIEADTARSVETLKMLMAQIKGRLKADANKTDSQLFCESLERLFTSPSDSKEVSGKFSAGMYVPFFKELVASGHMQPYCNFVLQTARDEAVTKWLAANPETLDKMFKWANAHLQKAFPPPEKKKR